MNVFLLLHEAVCSALLFSVFCRLAKTDSDTRHLIRFAFCALGAVSALGIVWPLMSWHMAWFGVLLGAAMVVVQFATARYWECGTPQQFCCNKTEQ